MSKGIKSKHDKAKPNTHHAMLCSDHASYHAAYYRVSLSPAQLMIFPCHATAVQSRNNR